MNDTTTLDPITLREILVVEVGLDGEVLDKQRQTALDDLGLDSIALVELGVLLRTEHGVPELPEDANTLTFDELADKLCG
nr:acyl carrier protein [Herbihabitans rhizosphaerae]